MSSLEGTRPVPAISVVLPTLGNYEGLARVLDGYERQDARDSFEVLVVADLAEPEPARVDAAIGKRPYPVRRLTGRLAGASANRNAGWRAARAPIVLFTDNDTVPTRRLVSEHLASHTANPEREVAVAGHVRWAKGLRVTPFMKWLDRGVHFDYGSIGGESGTWAHLYTANASIKREMLELVGGYDEERLPYLYEDLDWGYRARSHGLRVVYNRRAVVDHWRPMTVQTWQKRAPMLAVSEWRFCQLHPDVEPWFWPMFSDAMKLPPGRRRGIRLARFVPSWVPWLGPMVWKRASLGWLQEIAPFFLEAWEQAASSTDATAQPDVGTLLAERSSQPGGS